MSQLHVGIYSVTPGSTSLPTVYSFAEGHLGNNFAETITIFNPNNTSMSAAVTFFVTRGATHFLSQVMVSIPANSQGALPEDTSIVVQSLPTLPIAAERG